MSLRLTMPKKRVNKKTKGGVYKISKICKIENFRKLFIKFKLNFLISLKNRVYNQFKDKFLYSFWWAYYFRFKCIDR
jgi:hypothetical protein